VRIVRCCALLLAVVLVGCGGDGGDSAEGGQEQAESDPRREFCEEAKLVIDDWWGNITTDVETREAITELRDEYRGELGEDLQDAIDEAKSDTNERMGLNDGDGLPSVARACNELFDLGIAEESA
jgi:hypothetical protein